MADATKSALPARFYAVALTQGASDFGSAIGFFGLTTWVLAGKLPHVTAAAGVSLAILLLNLAVVVPQGFLASPAGVWADRVSRSFLTAAALSVDAAIAASLIVLVLTHRLTLDALVLVTVIAGVAAAVRGAALWPLYGDLVSSSLLAQSAGFVGAIQSATEIGAPLAAASLFLSQSAIRAHNLVAVLGIDGLSTMLAVVVLLCALGHVTAFRSASADEGGSRPRTAAGRDLLSAIQFVGDEPILRDLLIVTMTVFFIMAADGVVLPLYVRYTLRPLSVPILGALPSRLAIFLCVGAIGGLIGGLGVWQSRTSIRDPRQLLAGGAVILGVVSMWLGQTTNSVLAWSLDAARMFVMVVVTSYTMSFWQQHTPDDMQGRVLGVRRTAQGVVVPLGMVVGTYISVRTSPGDAVTALGVLLFVVGLGMFYRWRRGRAEIQEA